MREQRIPESLDIARIVLSYELPHTPQDSSMDDRAVYYISGA